MKRVLLVMCVLVVFGCEPVSPPDNVTTFASGEITHYNLVVIDGCDYLRRYDSVQGGYAYELSHKGNCRSCRKWMMEMVHSKAERYPK